MALPTAVPSLPFMTRLKIAGYTLVIDVSRRSNYTVNRCISNLMDTKSPPSTRVINDVTATSSDKTVDPDRNLLFRRYVPTINATNQKLPLLVYIHGGGFTFFGANTKSFDDLCFLLAVSLPAVVVSVNYRLAPEHRFLAQRDDVYDTLKFIDSRCHEILPPTTDVGKCFLAGDSAGGNICHHVTLRACQDQSSQVFERVKIAGQALIQPFFGGEERTESEIRLEGKVQLVSLERSDWSWKAFLPDGADRNHEAANVLFGESGTRAFREVKFPATVMFVGGFDPLQDRQRRYVEEMKKNEKEVEMFEYPNAIHAFYGFPELPELELFVKDFKAFVHKQLLS